MAENGPESDQLPEGHLPSQPVPRREPSLSACTRWKLPLHAHISHVSATRDGKRIVVSTSGDAKHEGRLRLIDSKGKVKWIKDLKQPVKAQAISANGDLIGINTYDGKFAAYSPAGQKLWERDHLGRPLLLHKTKRVVVLNDDDSEPKTAFTTYDYKGNMIGRVSAASEPLDMDVPDDESFVAVTTTEKMIALYALNGKLLRRGILPGQAVAIEAAGGPDPLVYVVTTHNNEKYPQRLSVFGAGKRTGELVPKWTVNLDRKYEAVRSSGGTLFLYGNGHAGQALTGINSNDGKTAWQRSYPAPAAYSSLIFAGKAPNALMTAALDEAKPAGVLHVLGVESSGQAGWDAPIEASSGIYSYALAEQAPAAIVGTGSPGDGIIQYLAISEKKCSH